MVAYACVHGFCSCLLGPDDERPMILFGPITGVERNVETGLVGWHDLEGSVYIIP